MNPEPPYQPPATPPPQFSPLPPQRERVAGGDIAMKLLIGSAAGIGIGFGTCGMGALMSQGGSRAIGKFFLPLGLVVFGLSLLGFVVGCIWLLVSAIAGWRQ